MDVSSISQDSKRAINYRENDEISQREQLQTIETSSTASVGNIFRPNRCKKRTRIYYEVIWAHSWFVLAYTSQEKSGRGVLISDESNKISIWPVLHAFRPAGSHENGIKGRREIFEWILYLRARKVKPSSGKLLVSIPHIVRPHKAVVENCCTQISKIRYNFLFALQ